jgi:hypothetical protein
VQTVKSFLIRLIPLTIGLVIALGIGELIIRALPSPQTWNDRPPYYFKPTNAETLQDYRYPSKSAEDFRIAVIGDSYSFAPYMQFTDAFPKVLERMLNLHESAPNGSISSDNSLQTKSTAEVVNYGVPGYSTSHEVASAEEALKNGADLLLLQITLNDPELKGYRPIGITLFNTFGKLEVSGWKRTLLESCKLLSFVITRLHNEKTRRDYIEYFHKLFTDPKGRKVFEDSLAKMASLAKEYNRPIRAVIFPLFGLPINDQYPFADLHQLTAEILTQKGIPYLDLLELYKNIPIDRLQVIPGEDRHPNEIGHRMAAERIYDYLVNEQLIPGPYQINEKFIKRTQIVKEQPFTQVNK